ncbi:MAG: hypothetical protein H7282_04945 [Cytophagaceae bacterium]|nr:hypothetical protein [Cytophagaceae bacterium]
MTNNENPDEYYLVVKKGKKFLEGHSYSTAFGYKYYWTAILSEARHFNVTEDYADNFASDTGGKVQTIKR